MRENISGRRDRSAAHRLKVKLTPSRFNRIGDRIALKKYDKCTKKNERWITQENRNGVKRRRNKRIAKCVDQGLENSRQKIKEWRLASWKKKTDKPEKKRRIASKRNKKEQQMASQKRNRITQKNKNSELRSDRAYNERKAVIKVVGKYTV